MSKRFLGGNFSKNILFSYFLLFLVFKRDFIRCNSWSVKSRTGKLVDNEFLKNHGITILYLYVKPNPNPNSNPIEYWQHINSVICPK